MIQEVEKNLFRIQLASRIPLLKPPVNLYLFAGEDGLLWDAGYGTRWDIRRVAEDLKRIQSIMAHRGETCRIRHILISHGHGDHFAGARSLRTLTGGRILLTAQMAEKIASAEHYRRAWQEGPEALRPMAPALLRLILPFLEWMQNQLFGMHWIPDPDLLIPETGTIRAGNRILHHFPLPGHAEDHLGLYCPAEGFLLSGDHVLRRITPWMGPPRSSIDAYEASLEKLLSMSPLNRIFPAHGSPVEEPVSHLEAALNHSRKRTLRVLQAVREAGDRGISFYALLRQLYPSAPSVTRISAEGWVLLTLRMLMEKGLIHSRRERGKWRFRAVSPAPSALP